MPSVDGPVCRTAVAMSVARAQGIRLARVRVSARIVGCPEVVPRSGRGSRGSRGSGRGWDSTMLPRRVCAVTALAVVGLWVAPKWFPEADAEAEEAGEGGTAPCCPGVCAVVVTAVAVVATVTVYLTLVLVVPSRLV